MHYIIYLFLLMMQLINIPQMYTLLNAAKMCFMVYNCETEMNHLQCMNNNHATIKVCMP